jgi:DNA-binding MarR family transcriptional regulator
VKSRLQSLLGAVMVRADAAEREALSDDRLSDSLAAVLAAIMHVGRREGISGIARLLEVERSYVTKAVVKLEQLGYVHTVLRDGSSIRSVLVTIEGIGLMTRVNALDQYVDDSVLGALSVEERNVLFAILEKVAVTPEVPAVVLGAETEPQKKATP